MLRDLPLLGWGARAGIPGQQIVSGASDGFGCSVHGETEFGKANACELLSDVENLSAT